MEPGWREGCPRAAAATGVAWVVEGAAVEEKVRAEGAIWELGPAERRGTEVLERAAGAGRRCLGAGRAAGVAVAEE